MHKFDLHSCNITEKHQTTNEAPPQHLTTEMDEMQGWMEMILCDYHPRHPVMEAWYCGTVPFMNRKIDLISLRRPPARHVARFNSTFEVFAHFLRAGSRTSLGLSATCMPLGWLRCTMETPSLLRPLGGEPSFLSRRALLAASTTASHVGAPALGGDFLLLAAMTRSVAGVWVVRSDCESPEAWLSLESRLVNRVTSTSMDSLFRSSRFSFER